MTNWRRWVKWGVRRMRIVYTTYTYVEVSKLEVDAGTDDFEPHTA